MWEGRGATVGTPFERDGPATGRAAALSERPGAGWGFTTSAAEGAERSALCLFTGCGAGSGLCCSTRRSGWLCINAIFPSRKRVSSMTRIAAR